MDLNLDVEGSGATELSQKRRSMFPPHLPTHDPGLSLSRSREAPFDHMLRGVFNGSACSAAACTRAIATSPAESQPSVRRRSLVSRPSESWPDARSNPPTSSRAAQAASRGRAAEEGGIGDVRP